MSSVLRKYKWFPRDTRAPTRQRGAPAGAAFFFFLSLIGFFHFFSSGVGFLFFFLFLMNEDESAIDSRRQYRFFFLSLSLSLSLVRPSARWWWRDNMILAPANDAKWHEHESSVKLNRLREWMTENDVNMTESERLEKWSRGFISIRASW